MEKMLTEDWKLLACFMSISGSVGRCRQLARINGRMGVPASGIALLARQGVGG